MGTLPARKPSGKPMNNLELVERICASSATLGEARRVHVQAFGTLIPHVFMGAVLARVGKCLVLGSEHARAEHKAELENILEALELGMRTGDRETRNVIAISFVYDSEVELFFDDLKAWLGPKTLGQVSGK
ncbi:MAG TPA: hypothetical protein VFJ86_14685 [Usitatibacter sp.]|jgi:hypothetical protein|nr:hypothetical protein [Usitatibacter sp.]